MSGACRPACAATSEKQALNGKPEGLPRGCALTARVETPWPKARTADTPRSEITPLRLILLWFKPEVYQRTIREFREIEIAQRFAGVSQLRSAMVQID